MTFSEPSPWPAGGNPDPQLCGEEERLATLASYNVQEMAGDAELARLARFAAHLCATPTGAVSLVEAERQIFLASEGLAVSETPRSTSLCSHAMLTGEIMLVADASEDARFADFTSVTSERHLRFYAGAPLISAEGAPLGALCVTDTVPRPEGLSELQREGLLVLADAVKRRLLAHRQASEVTAAIRQSADRLQSMIDSVPDIAWSAGPGAQFDYVNARWRKSTGLPSPRHVEDWRAAIHPDEFERTRAKFLDAVQRAVPFEDEWRMRQADGTYRWVLSRAVPSTDDPETARWFGTLTDIDDAYRISKERELVAGELAHRIKNIFSVIIGLISLHARGDATHEAFASILSDNIRALSRAQEFALQIDRVQAEDLKGLLEVLMAPYGAPSRKESGQNEDVGEAVTITGDAVTFGARAATPLALVFHEMATNSAKYGALSAVEGKVTITLQRGAQDATITWQETGGPTTQPPTDKGFGSRLMSMAIEHQLGGEMQQIWLPKGLRAVITLPLERL
ncbi:MAG: PAS domain-containing protein [Pseudomonadota bacterium]